MFAKVIYDIHDNYFVTVVKKKFFLKTLIYRKIFIKSVWFLFLLLNVLFYILSLWRLGGEKKKKWSGIKIKFMIKIKFWNNK